MSNKLKHPDAGVVHLPFELHSECGWIPAIKINDAGEPELGSVHPLKDGQPLTPGAELVMMHEDGRLRVTELGHQGPAQVATKPYRDGWERTFDKSLN